jgi:hypothetical protein
MVHYVAHNPEAQLGPKIIPGLNEFALAAVGVKNACLSVSVDGQVVDRMLPKKLDFPAVWVILSYGYLISLERKN